LHATNKPDASSACWSLLLVIAALMGPAVCIAQSPTFSIQVLHDFSGGAESFVYGINNAGQIAGVAITGLPPAPPFSWEKVYSVVRVPVGVIS